LAKLIKIGQNNATKLDAVLENQERFQAMLDAQQSQITAIMAKFAGQPEETIKGKGKGKGKVDDDFYRVSIYHFFTSVFTVIFTYNYLHYRMPLGSWLMSSFMSIKQSMITSLKVVLSKSWKTMNTAPINSKRCAIIMYLLICYGIKDYIQT
jgi:hypothetical protein